MKTKEELKLYFENGDKPTQEHFWAWLDSYWHKDEKITESAIDSVEKVIPFIIDDIMLGHSLSLSIPKNVKKIERIAFQYSGMNYQITEVNFNEGLENIGTGAFQGQNIKKIKTPSTLKFISDVAFNAQENSVNGTDSLEEIVLNEGLISIGASAFYCQRATAIERLYIPKSVKSVGENAFNIPSLKTVSALNGLDLSNAGIPPTAKIMRYFDFTPTI
ncbi:leucine-rich repeat domain-containing protein [Chryseobacterium vrystaatense]|uniref:Leucine rich repeat-containing protein n=1 Tax=Chryseobacterium vrystaatense TaxID=307480 RepID=A0A1M4VAD6_9FLAO|nr:leucine-rich repeat domain-containing protein [Chryseobacterium vrystaatense]SHE65934.1 Leucine rich repeat-containing protein [Chryseobacterium vrystaatense]